MCILCYEFGADEDWTDTRLAPQRGTANLPRERHRRAAILRPILRAYGLQVTYPGTGQFLLLSDAKGASAVAATLPEVCEQVEQLSGRSVDVLDELLLDRLSRAPGEGAP